MGCFSTRCALTNLQFKEGDPVILVPLNPNEKNFLAPCYPTDKWMIECLPMRGTYDGYGGAEFVQDDAYEINVKLLSTTKGFSPDIWNSNTWSLKRIKGEFMKEQYVNTSPLDDEGDKQAHALVHPKAWDEAIRVIGDHIHPKYSLVQYLKSDEAKLAQDAEREYFNTTDQTKREELFDIFFNSGHPLKHDCRYRLCNILFRMSFVRLPAEEQEKVAELYDQTIKVCSFMELIGAYWQPTFCLGPQSRFSNMERELDWAKFKINLLKETMKADEEYYEGN